MCKAISFVLILFLSVIGFGEKTTAAEIPSEISSQMAEYIYFTGVHNPQLGQWVRTLNLTSSHKAEIQAYLKEHHLENTPLPHTQWKYGSPIITINSGIQIETVDFSKAIAEHKLIVNGQEILVPNSSLLKDVLKKFKEAEQKQNSLFQLPDLFEARANAAESNLGLYDFIIYHSGIDYAVSCQGFEGTGGHICGIRSDFEMIKADINENAKVSEFKCEGNRFKSFKYYEPEFIFQKMAHFPRSEVIYAEKESGTTATYDGGGNLIAVTNFPFDIKCDIKDGKIAANSATGKVAPECTGRTPDEYNSEAHPLKIGDIPKLVGIVGVPLQRLQSCCKSDCKDKIAALIAQEKTETATPARTD